MSISPPGDWAAAIKGAMNAMELLTDELRAQLPALYAQDRERDPVVYIKFFTPGAGWTWYVAEGSPEPEDDDFRFFGFIFGDSGEWGYFSLRELESVRGPFGLLIERDLHFEPARWSEVKARYFQECGESPGDWSNDLL